MIGLAEKNHNDGFVIFINKNGNGVNKEFIQTGEVLRSHW